MAHPMLTQEGPLSQDSGEESSEADVETSAKRTDETGHEITESETTYEHQLPSALSNSQNSLERRTVPASSSGSSTLETQNKIGGIFDTSETINSTRMPPIPRAFFFTQSSSEALESEESDLEEKQDEDKERVEAPANDECQVDNYLTPSVVAASPAGESSSASSAMSRLGRTPLEDRKAINVERNAQRLIALGFPEKKSKAENLDDTTEDESDSNLDDDLPETGMLFATRHNNIETNHSFCESPSDSTSFSNLSQLYDRYPFRESQIKLLSSLVGGTIGCAARSCRNDQSMEDVYVPSPIFVTGPGGSGKTCVVRDVVGALKYHDTQSTDPTVNTQPFVGTAYVNCATIDPSAIEAVVERAFDQLVKGSGIDTDILRQRKRRMKRRRKQKRDQEVADESGSQKCTRQRHDGMREHLERTEELQRRNDGLYQSNSAIEDEESLEDRIELSRIQLSQAGPESIEASDSEERKQRRTVYSRKLATRGNPNLAYNTDGQIYASSKKVENMSASHGVILAFGRAIAPLFGGGARDSHACAFLILDQAERLLSLSAERSPEKSNYLAQFLLLPKVVGLNLTIIVITSHTLLDCSRINNVAPVEKALGSIAIGIRPIRIHFPSYSGKDALKVILMKPAVAKCVIGESCSDMGATEADITQRIFSSFVETLVHSLIDLTRDVREMIRMGRVLWPLYIVPLHPDNIERTVESARSRIAKRSSTERPPISDAAVQKELRIMLDERILPLTKSCFEERLFTLRGGIHDTSIESSKVHDLPYLSKCLLLAAFICQHNKHDKDKRLFAIDKAGRRTRRHNPQVETASAERTAYGSTDEQQRLKMLRPRLFPFERMLSVFVSIVGLHQSEDKLMQIREGKVDVKAALRSMGSSVFFESMAQLCELGLLHEAAGSAFGENGLMLPGINMNSARFWCGISHEDAEVIASAVGVPLSHYLI